MIYSCFCLFCFLCRDIKCETLFVLSWGLRLFFVLLLLIVMLFVFCEWISAEMILINRTPTRNREDGFFGCDTSLMFLGVSEKFSTDVYDQVDLPTLDEARGRFDVIMMYPKSLNNCRVLYKHYSTYPYYVVSDTTLLAS